MTDIKSYRAEKEKREQKQEGYREKIKRHKLLSFYRLLAVAVVAKTVVKAKMLSTK
jgi:Flp pilus assembly protein TadB